MANVRTVTVKHNRRRERLPRVIIAGGSGTLGQALAADLHYLGYDITILTRTIRHGLIGEQVLWDGKNVNPLWANLLKGSVLINLAGELVDRPNTPLNTALLEASRVDPTVALATASREYGRPKVWLQMSTMAIYGDSGDALQTETSPVAEGPAQMAGVARAWEDAFGKARAGRKVVLRTGVVFGHGMPALQRLVTMTRWLLGGQVGDGRQYVSWIHVHDFLKAVRFLLLDPAGSALSDVVNVTSPRPVRNRYLMRILRQRLWRPWTPATPVRVVEWGAKWVFKTDPALALTGRKGYPEVLLRSGFEFTFPTVQEAMADLLPTRAPLRQKMRGWRIVTRRLAHVAGIRSRAWSQMVRTYIRNLRK